MESADSARPSFRGRPPLPTGPRTRIHSLQNHPPEPGGSSLLPQSSTSSPCSSYSRLESSTPSLPLIEETLTPDSIPPSYAASPVLPIHSPFPKYLVLSPTSNVGVQAGSTPLPTPSNPVVKVIPKPAALVPPPPIKFDLEPIPFRGLPLEAAQWTFSSSELQQIVSRAIRLSARESFIRVLSIETLDKGVVSEAERLETLRITTQSKYRFQVHRRTMILQAINSSASAVPNDPDLICSLADQLSDITQVCDRLTEELLRIADQQAQLAKVQDLHWASSLAIALRKINKSYERRSNELLEARERIEVLTAELEEAWKEAETIAKEMDGLGTAVTDEESEEDEDLTTHTAHVVGVTGTALATPAKLVVSPEVSAIRPSTQDQAESESLALRNSRSRRQSSRSDHSSKWDQIAAAKTRSRLRSDASLRVTKGTRSKAGHGSQPPPVPTFPGAFQQDSFLDLNAHSEAESKSYPFSVNETAEIPAVGVDTAEERDSVPSIPFPIIRHDSGGRSSSRYSKSKLQRGRHSVPMPALLSSAAVPSSSSRSGTP